MTQNAAPEIGRSIRTCGYDTNLHDVGDGFPAVLLHGSGAGVSAWANWRGTLPGLSAKLRVLAPDLVGFGFTERPALLDYEFMGTWVRQIVALLDALSIEKAHLVGNSFGGALALHIAAAHPDRVSRIVLMGSAGVPMPVGSDLDFLWGYTPSIENMRRVLRSMVYDQTLVRDDLAQVRYQASLQPGIQEAFAAMFPAPRQRWADAMVVPEAKLRALRHEALIVHGREDKILPVENGIALSRLINRSQLHVIGQCGHWIMIEHRDRFNRLVLDFLTGD